MQKTFLLFLIKFLLCSFHTFAQTKALSPKEASLCFTWKADSITVNGVKNIPEKEQQNNTITFKSDHTLISVNDGVEEEPATWQYDEKLNEVIISNNELGELFRIAIIELNDNRMIAQLKIPIMNDKTIVYTSKTASK